MPTSDYGNDVEIEVNASSAGFLLFDEASFTLTIAEGVTSNADEGIYVVKINLFDGETDEESSLEI